MNFFVINLLLHRLKKSFLKTKNKNRDAAKSIISVAWKGVMYN